MGQVISFPGRLRPRPQTSTAAYQGLRRRALSAALRIAAGHSASPVPLRDLVDLSRDAAEHRGLRYHELGSALKVLAMALETGGSALASDWSSRCRDAAEALSGIPQAA